MAAPTHDPDATLSADPARTAQREPIAVFRVEGVTEGWIPVTEGRISDGLNQSELMTIETDATDGANGAGNGRSIEFDLDDVVAVAPAPRPPSPARISRRRHPIEVEAGPYLVKGIAHLPIGADPKRFVASTGRRWLPLTECRVSVAEDEWAVEVVIVNLDHASRSHLPQQEAPKFG